MADKPARRRRTRAEMDSIRDAMIRLAAENEPLSVRQLFYLLVCAHVIAKLETEYKNTVVRLALELRQAGGIPWEWIVDRTRWLFKPKTYDSLVDALNQCAQGFRRSLWTDVSVRVQIWCESMSVAGIIMDETEKWDVPLYPGKGHSSHDFLRTAARDIAFGGTDTIVYLLGDYDPSGRDIIRFVTKMLREYAAEVDPSVSIDFETLAVTEEQIVASSLPSHPAKETDPRMSSYRITEAVELEAIPPNRLRELVRDAITRHLDPGALDRLHLIEQCERELMFDVAQRLGKPGMAPGASQVTLEPAPPPALATAELLERAKELLEMRGCKLS
jgi:hypothetical protein